MDTKSNGSNGDHAPRALPLLPSGRQQVPCLTCGLCCTYIAVEIDAPETAADASEILFYLYHDRTTVYYDADEGEDGWHVQFETRCQHLGADLKCQIYEQRPALCRDYEEKHCEVNNAGEGITFANAGEFLDYLRDVRPALYRAVARKYLPPESTRDGKLLVNRAPGPYKKSFRKLRNMGLR